MQNNHFSLFLNIVLAILFAGSIAFSYFFGNFGGISFAQLKTDYILKDSLRFTDLPREIQGRYIDKNIVHNTPKDEGNEQKVFDTEGNPLASEDTQQSEQIQDKVSVLENKIILLLTTQEELNAALAAEKEKNQNTQKSLLSGNLDKINEAEQQHYKNISQLTMKINELQRENFKLTQDLSAAQESLKKQLAQLQASNEEEKKVALQELVTRLEQEKQRYNTLAQELKAANQKSETLKLDIAQRSDAQRVALEKKDKEFSELQNKVTALVLEKNAIIRKNSENILAIEKSSSQKLQELKDALALQMLQNKKLKEEYAQNLTARESAIAKAQSDNKNKIDALGITIKNMQQEKSELENKFNQLSQERLAQTKQSAQNIVKLQEQITTLHNQLIAKEEQVVQGNDKVLQLQDKINTFESLDLDKQILQSVEKNDEKHNINYKIFNEKVAFLENQYTKFAQQSAAQLEDLKAQIQYKDKLLQNSSVLKEASASLKQELQKTKNENQKTSDALKAAKDMLSDMQLNFGLREEDYKRSILEFKAQIVALNSEKNEPKIKGNATKLQQISSISCDDMSTGNFELTVQCRKSVNEFLNTYDASHYFEIIPIIGVGGFYTLNLIRDKSALDISDKEIVRLTDLANLGLGKYRAKEAGLLIEERFGDLAKISYAVYNIQAKGKRGFVIRAYK